MNDQAMLARQQAYGLSQYQLKDPTVSNASDAVAALKKRAEEIRGHLAKVDGWKAELAQIDRMVSAADGGQ